MLQPNLLLALSKSISLKLFFRSLILLFLLQGFFSLNSKAQGNLIVMPRRVVFEGAKRSDELNLGNIGKDTATYVISMIHIRMKEDGSFEQISQPDSGQNFSDNFLRFFPRRVTLAPNESQLIKVQLVKTNELQEGEYRSHLYFRAIPKEKPLGETDPAAKDSGIQISIVPIFGISIPTIIRVGTSTSTVQMSDVNLHIAADTAPNLNITFTRTGNMSVYGDITVDHIAPDGKVTQVSVVKGLAVYTPNNKRRCHLLLDKTKQVNYHSGKLHIVYAEKSINKQVVLAETDLVLK
jgi:P pilus assembly chaperone PapD